MEDKEAIGKSQHGFTNSKLWLTNLRACSRKMAGMVCEERTVIVHLDFHRWVTKQFRDGT